MWPKGALYMPATAPRHPARYFARDFDAGYHQIRDSSCTQCFFPLSSNDDPMTFQNLPGQPHVAYRDGELFVDDVQLGKLAREYGTPLFVYSRASMLALATYQRGFAGRNVQICYAMKANSSLGVLQVFAQVGCGFDIVSGGELERVLAAGAAPAKIIFTGVGKTRTEMHAASWKSVFCFNVESEPELEVLNEVALSMGSVRPSASA